LPWVHVDVKEDHLRRLLRNPLVGVIELVWNALDADASDVRVSLGENELGGIDEVRVTDDGTGMTPEFAVEVFKLLGGSWKASAVRSPGERPLHGRSGEGRWKAFGIGPRVRWETVAEVGDQRMLTVIEGHANRLDGFEIGEPTETERPTGTVVTIDSFLEPPVGLQGESARSKVTTTFALAIEAYPIKIFYDGVPLRPGDFQLHRADYDLELPTAYGEATVTVIEWAMNVDRLLYLCDADGTPLQEVVPHIQAPGFDFTGYLRWAGFSEHLDLLLLAEMGSPELEPVMDKARERLREHFRERSSEVTKRVIENWKQENAYPYEGEPRGTVEKAERDLFDVVALTAAKTVNSSGDAKAKRLQLRLMRHALETDPGALQEVLENVLELPPDRMEELRQLLQQTTLAAIVTAARLITNRLKFLEAMKLLVFDQDSKAQLKERSQLHRILASETWLFGEEYALTADDESLNTVLTRHLSKLGRDRLSDDVEVLDLDGRRRIVDLMLARSTEQAHNRLEHLVVELKAPKVKIGSEQLTQIKTYAYAVVADERFDKVEVSWDFVVVSNTLDEFAEHERNQTDRKEGLLWQQDNVRIWVKTWAEIIQTSEHRLKFVRRALEYAPTQGDALDYLRVTHEKYLPSTPEDAN
jgi:hypothetical protein